MTTTNNKIKILLIGDACIDVYKFGTVDRISPEAPVPVFKYSHEEEKPGMAGNVQKNLEALGCVVLPTFQRGKPSVKTRFIDTRSHQHIMRYDEDNISEPLKYEEILWVNDGVDAVVISDYDKGFITEELIRRIIYEYPFKTFIDTKKKDLSKFNGAYVKINSHEYSLLRSENSDLIVTMGAAGARYKNKRYTAPPVEVSDVCGAGDTFLAALTYKWCQSGGDMDKALRFAASAGAVTVTRLGNYAPTVEEVEKLRDATWKFPGIVEVENIK